MSKAEELANKWDTALTTRAHVDAGNSMADELRRLSAANAKLIAATTRVLRSFPTDMDMHYLGWDQVDVDEACNAYDAAHAEIEKAQGAQS